MPPRVTYWTGTWDPAREAISKEIEALRRHLTGGAPVFALSSGQRFGVGSRALRLSAGQWPLLRLSAPLLERFGRITHVFGSLDAWHLLRAVGRRPTVMTLVIPGRPAAPDLHARVRLFVAESEPLAADLARLGVPADRVRIIYPGVDLDTFSPAPAPPPGRFRLLFASSPADPREFEARGIPLLVEAARLRPELDVVLLWREWGDQDAAFRRLEALRPPPNLHIERRRGRTMASIYQSVHAVACVYEEGFGKSCPNSVVEALACGVPALVSAGCGIGGLIARHGAGIVAARTPAGLAAAVSTLQRRHAAHARAARDLAVTSFGMDRFLREYRDVYRDVAAAAAGAVSRPALGAPFAPHPHR